jgi:ABC-type glutathione transport system ATPase component
MSAARGTALLEVRNLRISFGSLAAVRGADLTIYRGETHCVVGESGCGKSVTALAVMGLLARNGVREADRLAFDGEDLLRLSESQLSRCTGAIAAARAPRRSTGPRTCSRSAASPRRGCGSASIRTSSPADCASA